EAGSRPGTPGVAAADGGRPRRLIDGTDDEPSAPTQSKGIRGTLRLSKLTPLDVGPHPHAMCAAVHSPESRVITRRPDRRIDAVDREARSAAMHDADHPSTQGDRPASSPAKKPARGRRDGNRDRGENNPLCLVSWTLIDRRQLMREGHESWHLVNIRRD